MRYVAYQFPFQNRGRRFHFAEDIKTVIDFGKQVVNSVFGEIVCICTICEENKS